MGFSFVNYFALASDSALRAVARENCFVPIHRTKPVSPRAATTKTVAVPFLLMTADLVQDYSNPVIGRIVTVVTERINGNLYCDVPMVVLEQLFSEPQTKEFAMSLLGSFFKIKWAMTLLAFMGFLILYAFMAILSLRKTPAALLVRVASTVIGCLEIQKGDTTTGVVIAIILDVIDSSLYRELVLFIIVVFTVAFVERLSVPTEVVRVPQRRQCFHN